MFSMVAPAYAERYGVPMDELKAVLARIASKNHHNGARNPRAQFRREMSVEQILAMPEVAGCLSVFDCAGVADGAAAAIVCRAEDAHRYTDTPLYVKALSFVAGNGSGLTDPAYDYTTFPEIVRVRRGRLRPGRHHRTRAPSWPWRRCTTASRPPSSCSWRTSASASGAPRGRRSRPAPSTSPATCP